MSKDKEVNILIEKLKSIMRCSLQKNNCERAMAAISAGCQILYEYNQYYTDYAFEEGVVKISDVFKRYFSNDLSCYKKCQDTILFYDGFGLDNRGVAKMYLNALKKNGYKIVYVTSNVSKGKLEKIQKILEDATAKTYYIDFTKSYTKWTKDLLRVFLQTNPKSMFFYSTPHDVSGAVAFAVMEGLVDRFLIDLTDHAFWLGVRSNDFFCGSREMSASNQFFERGIERKRLIKLGVNLIIDEGEADHLGLPFNVRETKYIFSGGALYKTLGDEEKYYYRIVDHILGFHRDVFFLYAGSGDTQMMKTILEKYPARAFLIPERKDFYYLIQNCILYLNTYPMFGGLMMKYSANAGKIPITLKHENDSDGLLVDQKSRLIEYYSYEELIADVDKLLDDPEYLKTRETLLAGSVISEERFVNNVRSAIEEHHTDYEHGQEHLDITRFKKEYYDRFDLESTKMKISKKINKSLFINFIWMPIHCFKRVVNGSLINRIELFKHKEA